MSDIVETAKQAGKFQTLVTAIQVAGLVETLKEPGPYTVFAPTDEAFSKLPPGTVESLLKDLPKLRAVLTYHVVAGQGLHSEDAMRLARSSSVVKIPTVQGQPLKVRSEGLILKRLKVNEATVIQPDVKSSNGVIHIIDSVLLPP